MARVDVDGMIARVTRAAARLGGDDDRDRLATVVVAQDSTGRHHHTTRHLAEMFAELDRLVAMMTPPGAVPAVVELAVAFHDAVYDPVADDNEARSGALATTVLGEVGVGPGAVAEVARLVELTATHDAGPDDDQGALLVDADLWILSAPPDRYDRYVVDVRTEYGHVSDDDWRTGRAAVLARLDDHLATVGYLTGPEDDRARRTTTARSNLARERSSLDAAVDAPLDR